MLYYKLRILDKGEIFMCKSIYAAIIGAFFLCFPGAASAEFDPYGKWLLEGSGYAEKSFLRVELKDWGELFVHTELKNETRYVTGYDVKVTLDASKLNINAWKYEAGATLETPIAVPDVEPTMNDPFALPPVKYDDLTYVVEFLSTTSGTVRIFGYISGGVEVNSISAVWREGTEKPKIPNMTSGCNYGAGAAAMLATAMFLVMFFSAFFTSSFKKRT